MATSCRGARGARPATLAGVRIATWNVNSVKQRVPRLLPWLEQRRPDVVCLQETKLTDEAFATLLSEPLAERGYVFAHHGQGQWNGVAILSRVGLDDVEHGFGGQPDYDGRAEARAISATCGGVRVHSLYVPNGREVGHDHYAYKLAWLDALRAVVQDGPADVALCGDMNIAPADADLFDPAAYVGHTHVTAPERDALDAFDLVDVLRERWPEQRVFSYWDYRAGMFHQDLGMRIDLILASAGSPPAPGPHGSTGRPARASCPRTTRPSSSTSTTHPTVTSDPSCRHPRARPSRAGR